ncbi:cysteine desulfurase [Actinobacteria bacterium YIM 96077]|uniref:cysteine desulfurase n=1 Tax=Phytoactinopolyspora halophila TaxID=1981511 RepID=A0A329QPE2_9ACTN|nr:cysteine desulfurase family protein [Phytoactinopolyspora halophila]AYY14587.1 cysteine desulfurase [Actinobacteria bacterium YIM 96077]RAW14036.1 cysteine desulfurase NifS [Phytoactinopolyspora halophila]
MTVPTTLRRGPVYMDYNATTPVDPRVVEACLPYLTDHFGNPSSGHAYGKAAHEAVITARGSVAGLLDCAPDDVVFTGGGSESDTLAIRGAALAHRARGSHIITQATEHPAVLAACDSLARLHGFRITRLPVDDTGKVDPAELDAAITPDTVLVSIMHANNETGTVQPIEDLADRAHAHGVVFHTDASQTAGKAGISVRRLGVDLMTVTGHKMYAPKGIGVLYVRPGLQLEPAIYGGGQERGLRAGTENVALIVAFGHAARLARDNHIAEGRHFRHLRDTLHQQLDQQLPGRVHLNGHPTSRLPNTLNISIDGVPGARALDATPDVAASSGSACHEGETQPSMVLTAMSLPAERARCALRLTLGRWSTHDDISRAATSLSETAHAIERESRAR